MLDLKCTLDPTTYDWIEDIIYTTTGFKAWWLVGSSIRQYDKPIYRHIHKFPVNIIVNFPGSWWAGKERARYPLFAHVLTFPEILGNRKLSCYSFLYNCDDITYTYRYVVAHFLTNDGSILIIHSPAPSSSLRRVGTSDLSLKKVQVATRLDFCWEKYVFIGLLPGSLCDSHCVTICHKL